MPSASRHAAGRLLPLLAAIVLLGAAGGGRAADVSPPAMLQWFEGSWATMEKRTADVFLAGYGAVWTPPPGRADQGNFSVGYDVYDRFDLGKAGSPTMYGTETGLRAAIRQFRAAGIDAYADLVWNHNGYSDLSSVDGSGHSFYDAGGYPGLNITLPGAIDGDFHSSYAGGDIQGRLAGLIDIAQESNHPMIRNPVPGFSNNIRAGTVPAYGRLANVPDEGNRRFYPDRQLSPIMVFDPSTGEANIPIYPFNAADPAAGDPVAENALGYLMRNARWLIADVGFEGFRLDAVKHFEPWVLNYYDRAVYRANPRTLLDGSTKHVFGFGEAFDGNKAYLQSLIRKDINPADPGRIGGNRDMLDFPLFFALRDKLGSTGQANTWSTIRSAHLDLQDDGFHNGSQGVMFVQSHDSAGPYALANVAHAYVLMHPGNAIVYFNGKEFGDNRDFPRDGRGDALGGLYGTYITRLVEIRNTHGRGNYLERWINDGDGLFAYERQNSALVLLSNRGDTGFDSRTLHTSFAPGTPLIELTGNALNDGINPVRNATTGARDIPPLIEVNADGTVNVRFLRNSTWHPTNPSFFHGNAYLIYGPSGPQGTLSLTPVAQTLAGETPTNSTNGTARLADISVVQADTFTVQLNTTAVNLLGYRRDRDADGDNALLNLDGGLDLNGNGQVDYRQPGAVSYGFEEFVTTRNPGYAAADGNGQYAQAIDATRLGEGYHYLTVRAFRHRNAGEPAIYTDFRQVIYVDRLPPVSAVASFAPWDPAHPENRDLVVRSVDQTANQVHVFLDLPAAMGDAAILDLARTSGAAGLYDRDLFRYGFFGIGSGNHVVTVVTREISDTVNVQRFPGIALATGRGRGGGDLNFDGVFSPADLANVSGAFEEVLWSQDAMFNPAADVTGDGRVDSQDLFALGLVLITGGADAATLAAYDAMLRRRGDVNADGRTDTADIDGLRTHLGGSDWRRDLSSDGVVDGADVDALIRDIFRTQPGDANLDGAVDGADSAIASAHYRRAGGWGAGDFTGDGRIDLLDLAVLARHSGASPAPVVAIPEPTAALSLLAGLLTLRRTARRAPRRFAYTASGYAPRRASTPWRSPTL